MKEGEEAEEEAEGLSQTRRRSGGLLAVEEVEGGGAEEGEEVGEEEGAKQTPEVVAVLVHQKTLLHRAQHIQRIHHLLPLTADHQTQQRALLLSGQLHPLLLELHPPRCAQRLEYRPSGAHERRVLVRFVGKRAEEKGVLLRDGDAGRDLRGGEKGGAGGVESSIDIGSCLDLGVVEKSQEAGGRGEGGRVEELQEVEEEGNVGRVGEQPTLVFREGLEVLRLSQRLQLHLLGFGVEGSDKASGFFCPHLPSALDPSHDSRGNGNVRAPGQRLLVT